MFDGLTLVAILAAVTVFSGTDATIKRIGIGTGVVFVTGTIVLTALAFSPDKARNLALRLLNLLPHGLEERIEGLLDSFLQGLQSLRSPASILIALALSFASWTVEVSMYVVVGEAFHLNVGIEVYYLIAAAANLALSVLASPGGVGPFEVATQAVLIDIYGVASGSAEAFAIALHALLLGPVIIVGFILLWAMQISLSDALGGRPGDRQDPTGDGDGPAKVAVAPHPAVE